MLWITPRLRLTLSPEKPAFVMVGILLTISSLALAQGRRIDGIFKDQDTNEDGKISADEAQRIIKLRFSQMDENGDLFVDRAELEKVFSNPRGDSPTQRRTTNSPNLPKPDFSNVKYGEHERCVMDIWLAPSEEKTPVIISVHGGGFVAGDKKLASRSVEQFRERGISFVAINYPFKNQVPWPEVFPQALRAIQFLRYHADKYNIDKEKVAMSGGSAGAGITLWALFHDDLADPNSPDAIARESTKPTCGVAMSTQSTYDQLLWHEILGVDESAITALKNREEFAESLGIEISELNSAKGIELRKSIDMLQMIDKGDPPVMLVNQRPNVLPGDLIHHPIHSIALKEKCDTAGVECKLVLADTPREERIQNIDFILEHLK